MPKNSVIISGGAMRASMVREFAYAAVMKIATRITTPRYRSSGTVAKNGRSQIRPAVAGSHGNTKKSIVGVIESASTRPSEVPPIETRIAIFEPKRSSRKPPKIPPATANTDSTMPYTVMVSASQPNTPTA